MDPQLRAFLIIYTIAFTWWLSTVIYRELFTHKDIQFLRRSYFCAPTKSSCDTYNCNGWCIGHFFNYLLLGFFAPKYAILAIIIGAVFELIETLIQNTTPTKFVDGKIAEDIFTNTVGTIVGYLLSPYRL